MASSLLPKLEAATIVDHHDAGGVATWRNLFVMVHATSPGMPIMKRTFHHMKQHAQKHPDGFAIMNVLAQGLGTLGSEERNFAIAANRELGEAILGFAMVLEGQGFWAASQLAVSSAIMRLSSSRFPRRSFHDVENAAEWQASFVDKTGSKPVDPSALGVVVREARERLR